MDTSLALIVALLACGLAIFLTTAALELEKFSRAKMRKLKESSRALAEQLNRNFPFIPRLRITGQMLAAAAFLLAIWSFSVWAARWQGAGQVKFFIPAIILLISFCLVQLAGALLSMKGVARLIAFYLQLCRVFFLPLAPILLPLYLAIRKIRQRQDSDSELTQMTAEDQILSLVEDVERRPEEEAANSGLEVDECRMLSGVIQLDKTFVHESMTPRVDIIALPNTSSVAAIKKAIVQSGHSRIPIYENSIDNISGVVYAKDLLDEDRVNQAKSLVELARQPIFIPETKNISDLLDEFLGKRNHLAIALDEYGGTAGMITIEDILEEIVGEIEDEYDKTEKPDIIQDSQSEGFFIVEGRTAICDVNRLLGVEISEEEDYDTIGGYISTCLGHIPKVGENIETRELEGEIIKADPRKIVSAKIRKKAFLDLDDEADELSESK